MTVSAVQSFVLDQVIGLDASAGAVRIPPIVGYITPPAVDDGAGAPRAYVWPSAWRGRRRAAPRRLGLKQRDYDLDVFLAYFLPNDDPQNNFKMPMIVEKVLYTLEHIALAATLYDPITGDRSELLDIGDTFSVQYAVPRMAADQRLLYFSARITTKIQEGYQA